MATVRNCEELTKFCQKLTILKLMLPFGGKHIRLLDILESKRVSNLSSKQHKGSKAVLQGLGKGDERVLEEELW